MSDRIDPDYNPSEKEIDDVARLLNLSVRRLGSVYYRNGNGNGSWRDWMLALCGVLAASGVIGIVIMYGNMTSLTTQVADLREETRELRNEVKGLEALLRKK